MGGASAERIKNSSEALHRALCRATVGFRLPECCAPSAKLAMKMPSEWESTISCLVSLQKPYGKGTPVHY